ncbi:hypothetical protein SAMN04489760_11050 [Syntrophus gentianae]|uniref:HD/PDEase domain-containing protein n=1 Tax=Syntrophus gentianae TaxID=43775 RepID=A0A1H7XEN1_9BACT|nr:HDIG domain-containing metalloprotein [Syntrophus gentianae]SEM31658.1 hypothetical protein SAMN04489760_11050 [Syntrophus gentianae]
MKIADLTRDYFNSLAQELTAKIADMPALSKNVKVQRMVILFVVAVILSFLLTPEITFRPPHFKIGSIAPKDIKADRDFLVEDRISTEQKMWESVKGIKSVYDYDNALAAHLISTISSGFSKIRSSHANIETGHRTDLPSLFENKVFSEAVHEFEQAAGIKFSEPELKILIKENFSQDIAEKIVQILSAVYQNGHVVNSSLQPQDLSMGITIRNVKTQHEQDQEDLSNLLIPEQAQNLMQKESESILQGTRRDIRFVVLSLSRRLLQPNLTFNKNATVKKKQEILNTIKPVFFLVQKNEMIVREGQKISEIDKEKLAAFYRKNGQESLANLTVFLGLFLTVILLSLVLYFWRTRNWPRKKERNIVNSLFLGTIAIFSILVAKAGIFIGDAVNRAFPNLSIESCLYAIPFAAGAMLIAVLTNRNLALVMSIFVSFLVSFLFDYDIKMSLFCFLGSVAASYHVVSCRQRSAFFKAGLFLGLFNMSVILCFGLVFKDTLSLNLIANLAMGLVGGLISGILVAGLTPLFESIFQYTTDIKLLELANLNSPIFQRMMMEAPGTYNHSVVVASLVEAAAEAIGANPLLAKVSAYYHDIGKLKKPLYFIENQRNGDNKHDKLSPRMSGLVIISHVKDGCEIAQQAKLGKEIISIIREHHGTGLVGFFYGKAKKDKDPSISSLPESDFRYPGPKPQTKEAGLVLLGDVIEASSRALSNPTPSRIANLVRDRIEKIFMDGQLDECELTMRDLSKIAEIFIRILNGIFHQRIDYPGQHADREGALRKDTNGHIDSKSAEKSKN